LIPWNFLSIDAIDRFADLAVTMGILPVLGIMAGRWWPYLMALPVVAVPIMGKTIRDLATEAEAIPLLAGICVYGLMPLFIVVSLALREGQRPQAPALAFVRGSLVLMTWVYFYLNWAFFRYPWPWEPWTGRTPHGMIFLLCATALTTAALCLYRREGGSPPKAPQKEKPQPPVPWMKPTSHRSTVHPD
jgi:hypothetical protein